MKRFKLKTVLVAFVIWCLSCTNPRNEVSNRACSKPIHLDKYGTYFKFFHNPDTCKINSNRYIVVNIGDCEGDLYIKEYLLKNNHLVFEGGYCKSKDTTIIMDRPLSPDNMSFVRDTFTFYLTRRNGAWKYYSESENKLINEEEFL